MDVTWLTERPSEAAGDRLRALLDETVAAPGVFNGLTALLAAAAGAPALYLSGAAFSASMGLPDVGLFTREELVDAVSQIARVVSAPVIVDADTGFGGPLEVMRTLRELEDAGAAAMQIEDQLDPKRCGHLAGKRVSKLEAMLEKVRAAVAARRSTLIIARTDARATDGFDEAVRRGRAFREEGADVVFPEALETEEEFGAFAEAVPGPLLANMTEFGRGPRLDVARLRELGYAIVIFPVSAARVAAQQVRSFYVELLRDGTQASWLERMLTRDELYDLIRYDDYAELDRSVSRDEP
ncbi:MAG TPA: methylisocitrate lyase [Actinomycetota bacterium]|nr:methylisocitrate lyase [Actinomycetota bacterium]